MAAQGSPQESPKNGENLVRSSGIVSMMTMLSRVFGLVRDMVIANYFGSSGGADAFFVAFKIPNFFRRLFGEGAFSQAFVPVLAEFKTTRDEAEVKDLVDRVGGTLGVQLLAITVVGVIAAPLLASAFAFGFVYNDEHEKLALAAEMLRITFPYLMLISLTAFSGAILNTYGRFSVPAFTPVLLNLSLILCAIYLRPYLSEPVTALAWGVLIAGVAQLTFQLPFLSRINMMPMPRIDWHHEGVRRILTLMLPAMFGVSVGQINLLLDTILASFLQTGSISWLYYSDRLLELPLALFGITIATVILPSLSKKHAQKNPQDFTHTLDWAMKMVVLVGFPASLALIYLAEPLITGIFYSGEMTQRDVSMAALSLRAYALGLLGHMLVKVLAPGYFARQDTRSPVKFGIIAMVTNMVLNLILIWPLAHAGLALATSLSAFLNAGLLLVGLHRLGVYKFSRDWILLLPRVLVASTSMLLFLYWLNPEMSAWYDWSFWYKMAFLILLCGSGAVAYLVVLLITGFRIDQMRHQRVA
jgi:putative peptidoglycan lipid II flippase